MSSKELINLSTIVVYEDIDQIADSRNLAEEKEENLFRWIFSFNGSTVGRGRASTLEANKIDLYNFVKETRDSLKKLSGGDLEANGWSLKIITMKEVEEQKKRLIEAGNTIGDVYPRFEVRKEIDGNNTLIYIEMGSSDRQLERRSFEWLSEAVRRLNEHLESKEKEWQKEKKK